MRNRETDKLTERVKRDRHSERERQRDRETDRLTERVKETDIVREREDTHRE